MNKWKGEQLVLLKLGAERIQLDRRVNNRRKFLLVAFGIALYSLCGTHAFAQASVAVSLSAHASPVEQLAADELAAHLRILYPGDKFKVGSPASGDFVVYLGTPRELPDHISAQIGSQPDSQENYSVKVLSTHEAAIAGGGSQATLFAVYVLLEKLGFGFYLSYNSVPAPINSPFSFTGWELADSPLVGERIIFNWHNFLSGCSTWNLADWQNWITQASRMRFNTIMVHAYGNNPMFSYSLNGQTKPTGYLSNTQSGRDWDTEHVLDVRKMAGAEGLFQSPVFGADASKVPEGERVPAAQDLMQRVFRFAASRGMGVTFAVDVDTESANPQNVIATLPPSARFAVQGLQLVNPDVPDGYRYYRAQVEQLMRLYPEITQIAVWFRGGLNSPWRALKPDEFPAAWQPEYSAAIEANPRLKNDPEAPSVFAIGKIVRAFRKALDETGHASVTLAAGSWRFAYLPSADAFMPANVALIPLDYSYEFPSDPVQESLRVIGRHRPVLPIVWAQHDDREFAGRSYVPFAGLGSLLRWSNSAGFGVIHWTTRPLDLFFKNVADQVWSMSEDEPLSSTSSTMAKSIFGAKAENLGSRYLLDWIYDGPAFGRETSPRFIDQIIDAENEFHGGNARLQLLEKIRPLASDGNGREWVAYFHDWELYAHEVFRAQEQLQKSLAALNAGNLSEARQAIASASPEKAIAQYAHTIQHGTTTSGEKGILVSLNLRWLPYFEAQRQAVGLDPTQIEFRPTRHEPLAQSPGRRTFDFDSAHHPIEVLGSKELGMNIEEFTNGTPCSSGMELSSPASLSLSAINDTPLHSGSYRVKLDISESSQVRIRSGTNDQIVSGQSEFVVQPNQGRLQLDLSPVTSPVRICGLSFQLQGSTQ